ncbi:DUF6779 domain-containing protein [Mycobacterium sp. WMMD1722]|uniref:DUF6779 domain-containing protein n=1 Tax=Mycobacterium sp. WMMD1722 TaxID=3404117 RepID=UPI003BF4D8BB
MTVLPRGSRTRRGGRRPAWVLMTVLLVLAIGASSALVFTDRVELLKLAVILALWAAVVAAFVSVIYRRQSDLDQAKARDLKYVYDLQLDREISARREYELTVEAQLRRELAAELQAQSADEVAALRAELAALRTNLEILFDTDLAARPAIEHDRGSVHAYSGWAADAETTGRVSSSRIDAEVRADTVEEVDDRTEESPIIDVPAEPQPPEPTWPPPVDESFEGGVHRLGFEGQAAQQDRPGRRHRVDEPAGSDWRPAPAEGQWIPAGTPGSNWVAPPAEESASPAADPEYVGRRRAPEPVTSDAEPEPPRGRHSVSSAEVTDPHLPVVPAPEPTGDSTSEPPAEPPAERSSEPAAEPTEQALARRHRSIEDTGGQSVADLLARLQGSPPAGGGRRRRAE